MYMPLRNACARMMATRDGGMDLYGARRCAAEFAPGFDQLGTVQAISAETGAVQVDPLAANRHDARSSRPAAGSMFGGDVNGRFRAFDEETGEVLWEINLGSAVTGFPITYAVDGRSSTWR